MPLYHICITKDATTPDKYIKFLNERTTRCLLVTENSDSDCKQVHMHCMFESVHNNDEGKCQSLRREFKKWFPFLDGNKDYSLKGADETGWIYICKGPDTNNQTYSIVNFKQNVTDVEVMAWHLTYWANRETHIQSQSNSTVINKYSVTCVEKPPRKKTLTWTQRLIQTMKDEGFQCTRTQICMNAITSRVLDEMGTSGKALDDMILSRLVQSVFNGLIEGDEREDWKQSYIFKVTSKMTIL